MSEFRRRLMMSIKNNSGMSIYDVMNEYMDVITPNGQLGIIMYDFEYGKTYHIIAKVARGVLNGTFSFYIYKGDANVPNIDIKTAEQGETMIEFTYTHEVADTYTRLGGWATDSLDRIHPIIVYIEEL